MRRLRVLYAHPNLGKPTDVRDEFEDAQAYVDTGFAEWIVEDRQELVETTDRLGAPETTAARVTARRTRTREASRGHVRDAD